MKPVYCSMCGAHLVSEKCQPGCIGDSVTQAVRVDSVRRESENKVQHKIDEAQALLDLVSGRRAAANDMRRIADALDKIMSAEFYAREHFRWFPEDK